MAESTSQTTLKTSRLILRAAREDDAAALFEAFGDPEAMKFWYHHDSLQLLYLILA